MNINVVFRVQACQIFFLSSEPANKSTVLMWSINMTDNIDLNLGHIMHRNTVFIDRYYCHEMWLGCCLFQSVSSGAGTCCHIHGHGSDGCTSEHKYSSGRFYAYSWRWMVWSSGEWWRSRNFAVWTQSFPASEPYCQCSLEWGKVTLMWKCLLHCMDTQHLVMWHGPCRTQRQARELISRPNFATRARLLSFNRT